MNIKTSVRVAKVKPELIEDVSEFVDDKHDIAWQNDIDKIVPLEGKLGRFGSSKLFSFHTYSIPKTSASKTLDDYLLLTQQGLQHASKIFPRALDKPIDAVTLLVDSSKAFNTWSDPEASASEKGFATGDAMLSAFDVFEPYFPLLQQYNTHVKTAGLLLKIANSVYMVEKEYAFR